MSFVQNGQSQSNYRLKNDGGIYFNWGLRHVVAD
jgi:hypothetical protein